MPEDSNESYRGLEVVGAVLNGIGGAQNPIDPRHAIEAHGFIGSFKLNILIELAIIAIQFGRSEMTKFAQIAAALFALAGAAVVGIPNLANTQNNLDGKSK
jgi:hypothetical protein